MSVSSKVVELRNRIAEVIAKNYEYGDGITVVSIGEFERDQGTSHTSGEYRAPIVLKEGDDLIHCEMEIEFAPDTDEVYEAYVINVEAGGVIGESIVDNPDLISHWMKVERAA